jgi:hypothetical protein
VHWRNLSDPVATFIPFEPNPFNPDKGSGRAAVVIEFDSGGSLNPAKAHLFSTYLEKRKSQSVEQIYGANYAIDGSVVVLKR